MHSTSLHMLALPNVRQRPAGPRQTHSDAVRRDGDAPPLPPPPTRSVTAKGPL